MFRNLKRSTARAAAVGAVAMTLTGGMALQQAAPAEALVFLAPLAPVIGAAVGGTGITAGGWALLAGGTAAIGAALHFGSPAGSDDLDRAIDWLMEPVDILGRPLDTNGQEVDDPKTVPDRIPEDVIVSACYTSACPQTMWVNKFVEYAPELWSTRAEVPVGCTTACTTTRAVAATVRLKGTTKYSGGQQFPAARARMTCEAGVGGPVSEHVSIQYLTSGMAYQTTDRTNYTWLGCPKEKGSIKDIVLEPITRAEFCNISSCTDSTNPELTHGGAPYSITYHAAGSGAMNKAIRTTVVCRDAAGVETTITADSPVSASSLTIPSCASRGLGEAVSVRSDFMDGDIIRKNIFSGSGTAGAGQKLEIRVDGVSCQVGFQACESWAGLSVVAPERVKCFLGGAEVALSQCNYLEGAYLVGGTPATKNNIDGDPNTWTPPSTVPGWIPHEETASGPQPNPNITPSPQPNPTPEPSIKPEPAPNTGTGTGTGTTTGTFPSSGTNPGGSTSKPNGKDCFGTSWSWNPIDWVVHPVSCALSWAFEPSKDVKTRIQTMEAKLSNKVPMVWFGVGQQAVSGGACPVDWQISFKGQSYPFICGTQADAILQTFRPVFGGMLVIAAVFPLVRSLFYSSIPVFKVNPS